MLCVKFTHNILPLLYLEKLIYLGKLMQIVVVRKIQTPNSTPGI